MSDFSIISIIIIATYSSVILILLAGWLSIPVYHKNLNNYNTTVSIIIPFRDEEKTILQCITDIVNQDYPSNLYEIICVDDHSSDQSTAIVNNLILQHPDKKIKLLTINTITEYPAFKKQAIDMAVAQATGDLIITTDADCQLKPAWISTIVDFYENHSYKMIVSPVEINEKGSFFGRMQSLEFLSLVGVTGSAINYGYPVMCNGANLAYERSAFNEVGGFTGNENIASGDDVFLMFKIKSHYKSSVEYLKSHKASVTTEPQKSSSHFFHQRVRWASKSRYYSDKPTIMLGLLVFIANLTLILNFFDNLFFAEHFKVFISLVWIKVGVDMLFLYSVGRFFKKQFLLRLFPLVQLLYVIYVPVVVIYSLFGKTKWKERDV